MSGGCCQCTGNYVTAIFNLIDQPEALYHTSMFEPDACRPYCNNWARLSIRQGGVRTAGSGTSTNATAPLQAVDELAASLARMGLKGSGRGGPGTEQKVGDDKGATEEPGPPPGNAAGGGGIGGGGNGVPTVADLSAHFHANFFELPDHMQPPAAAGGVRWFGSRSAPVLLAVPDSAAAAAAGSGAAGGAVATLNGFGAEAAAKLAHGFVELFGAEGNGSPPQPSSHRQKGYGLFFVPVYV